jgi:hypothetical protein
VRKSGKQSKKAENVTDTAEEKQKIIINQLIGKYQKVQRTIEKKANYLQHEQNNHQKTEENQLLEEFHQQTNNTITECEELNTFIGEYI